MKKLIYSLLAVVVMFSCTMQPKYKIEGSIDGLNSGPAILKKVADNELVTVDSVIIEDGKFKFSGSVDQADYFLITFNDTLGAIELFLDNVNITINAKIDAIAEAEVTGSELTAFYKNFNDNILDFRIKMNALIQEYRMLTMSGGSSNMERMKQIEEEYTQIEEQMTEFIKTFISENPSNVVTPFIALRYRVNGLELNELKELAANFGEELATSKYVIEINEKIATLEKVAIGQPYIDFTLNDPDGNAIALSSIVGGKYVLIDFWAGWCSPCRNENPVLVENYAKYKEKGFEIFGVSLDKKREKWVKAIEEDGITWPQVSDLKFWDCAARDLYAFNSIPHNVLLDKDGIIIAKNLRGEELGAKLAELLD